MTLSEVAQSWPTLCDPMDSSLLGSSVHGIFQAGVREWVAIVRRKQGVRLKQGVCQRSSWFQRLEKGILDTLGQRKVAS